MRTAEAPALDFYQEPPEITLNRLVGMLNEQGGPYARPISPVYDSTPNPEAALNQPTLTDVYQGAMRVRSGRVPIEQIPYAQNAPCAVSSVRAVGPDGVSRQIQQDTRPPREKPILSSMPAYGRMSDRLAAHSATQDTYRGMRRRESRLRRASSRIGALSMAVLASFPAIDTLFNHLNQ